MLRLARQLEVTHVAARARRGRCHEKLNGKPLFSKIDKMKICRGGRWAKASTPTGGPEGVCELEASRQAF